MTTAGEGEGEKKGTRITAESAEKEDEAAAASASRGLLLLPTRPIFPCLFRCVAAVLLSSPLRSACHVRSRSRLGR